MKFWVIVIGLIVLFWCIGEIFAYMKQKQITKKENIEKKEKEIEEIKKISEAIKAQNEQDREAIKIISKQKSQGFPWLANAFGDYFFLQRLKEADYLEHKPHPAQVSAERIREIARERRNIEEKLRISQGVINYYQDLFPFLEEFLGDIDEETLKKVLSRNIEEPIKEVYEIGVDPVRIYLSSLSEQEYQKLSSAKRN